MTTGWSQVSGLDEVRAMLASPLGPPTQEQLDLIYDEVGDDPPEAGELEAFPPEAPMSSALAILEGPTRLLGALIQNSELVPDVDLKVALLKRVIHGWSLGHGSLGRPRRRDGRRARTPRGDRRSGGA